MVRKYDYYCKHLIQPILTPIDHFWPDDSGVSVKLNRAIYSTTLTIGKLKDKETFDGMNNFISTPDSISLNAS